MVFDLEEASKNEPNLGTPPYSNRGAQNTDESALRSLVDWVSCTLKKFESVESLIDFLGLEKDKFREVESGKFGYKKHVRFGHIAIYFDGNDDMGMFLDISGQGCREFEVFGTLTWSELFSKIMTQEFNFTRLDIAVDDFSGYLKMSTIKAKVKNGEVRSRFKSAIDITKVQLSDGSSGGETLYMGSAASRIQIRFYDKKLEQESKDRQLKEGIDHWVRVEIQMRKEHANAVAFMIARQPDSLGDCVLGILNNYVTFCVKSKVDTNKARWKVAKFWENFLQGVGKISLSMDAPDLSIERSEDWIVRQTTPTLAMLYTAFEGDMTKFTNYLINGVTKMDDKHLEIINRFRHQHKLELLTKNDYHDLLNQNVYDLVDISKQIKKTS